MTFTLTADETKVVKSGSVDFSKFVDYESGNVDPMYFTFTAQKILDQNFTSNQAKICLLYTSPSPRDATLSRMPSSA